MDRPPAAGRARRLRLALLAGLIALVLADQFVLRVLMADGFFRDRRVPPFDPPVFSAEQQRTLDAMAGRVDDPGRFNKVFDPLLGWRNGDVETDGGVRLGPDGARWDGSPLLPERARGASGLRRLVTVGGSFTWAAAVEHEEAWSAVLEGLADGWEVANLGIGAQGLDQALLRLQRDALALRPDAVWMGLLPRAGARVLSRYRPLVSRGSRVTAFKPRFRLQGDVLVPVPLGVTSYAEGVAVVEDQRRFLDLIGDDDALLARCPEAFAPLGSRWSHHTALGRLWLARRERRSRLDTRDTLRDPASEMARLHDAIVRRGAALAAEAGVGFRLVVLPDRSDLRDRADHGDVGAWDHLVAGWRADGLAVTDLTGALLQAGGPEADDLWGSSRHYSAAGNTVVARALAPRLASP